MEIFSIHQLALVKIVLSPVQNEISMKFKESVFNCLLLITMVRSKFFYVLIDVDTCKANVNLLEGSQERKGIFGSSKEDRRYFMQLHFEGRNVENGISFYSFGLHMLNDIGLHDLKIVLQSPFKSLQTSIKICLLPVLHVL